VVAGDREHRDASDPLRRRNRGQRPPLVTVVGEVAEKGDRVDVLGGESLECGGEAFANSGEIERVVPRAGTAGAQMQIGNEAQAHRVGTLAPRARRPDVAPALEGAFDHCARYLVGDGDVAPWCLSRFHVEWIWG
jgi:hypothetical protein